MRKLSAKSGFAASVVGGMLLLELAVIRVAFTADGDLVYLFGRPINIVCAARQHFGIPCPTCGLTRGFVLTLHGHVGEAWRLSPSGPLAAIGMFAMGLALLGFALLTRDRTSAQTTRLKRWLQNGAMAYGGLATLIWITSWVGVVTRLK